MHLWVLAVDRKICRICRHSGFRGGDHWTGCNYIIDTGEKRPHDGDMCYGFEPMSEGRLPKKAKMVLEEAQKRLEDQRTVKLTGKAARMAEPMSVYDGFRMWINIMMS